MQHTQTISISVFIMVLSITNSWSKKSIFQLGPSLCPWCWNLICCCFWLLEKTIRLCWCHFTCLLPNIYRNKVFWLRSTAEQGHLFYPLVMPLVLNIEFSNSCFLLHGLFSCFNWIMSLFLDIAVLWQSYGLSVTLWTVLNLDTCKNIRNGF